MKKINKLTHISIFLLLFSCLFISCGTEEEPTEEALIVTVNTSNVTVGNSVTFTASSTISGDLTSVATFFVNDEQIEGNSFTPAIANESNEVYATYNGMTSGTVTFSSTDVIPSKYTQKVLVEDYTGTWCIYCPRMALILDFFTDYSDKVVPIAIHCEGEGLDDPWIYEHWEQMADVNNYNAPAQPRGKINRIFDVNMYQNTEFCPTNPDTFNAQLDSYLNQTAPLGLAVNSSLDGNSLSINVKVGFATDNISNPKLVVNLIEEELVHDQRNAYAGSTIPNCVFNQGQYNVDPILNFPQKHVLMKSYTDIFGDNIPEDEVSEGNVWSQNFNVSLPSHVTNSQNLYIVAFVVGNGDKINSRPALNVQRAKVGFNQSFD
ncbi:MAG: Omp28-related outer membrane protein [Moheibacter sp.]